MIQGKMGDLVRSGKALLRRGRLAMAGGLMLATLMCAGTQANADRVVFRFNGGPWSHSRHSGWHRYWGGPSIGFYYAPEPVYVVPGYDEPSYYSGPDFWYSDPSFGLSLNFGGGGYYDGYSGGYSDGSYYRYNDRNRYYDHNRYNDGDRYHGGYSHSGGDYRSGSDRYSNSGRYSGGSDRYSGNDRYSNSGRYSGGSDRYSNGSRYSGNSERYSNSGRYSGGSGNRYSGGGGYSNSSRSQGAPAGRDHFGGGRGQ